MMQIDPRWAVPTPEGVHLPPPTSNWGYGDQAPSSGVTIPYLGPEPPQSRPLGRFLRVALVLGGLSALARAALYLQRASLDRRLARGATADVASAIRGNQDALALITTLTLLLTGAALLANILWRQQRRPKGILKANGEAYVESPLGPLTPVWLRLALVGGVFIFLVGLTSSRVPTGAAVADLAHYRDWSAVTMFALAALWGLDYGLVVNADRRHDKRVGLSGEARQHPETVPYFQPAKKARSIRPG